MQNFTKEWVEYPFNPIALVSTAIAMESLFRNAIANTQCERNLRALSHLALNDSVSISDVKMGRIPILSNACYH